VNPDTAVGATRRQAPAFLAAPPLTGCQQRPPQRLTARVKSAVIAEIVVAAAAARAVHQGGAQEVREVAMLMFLTILFMSVLALAVCAAAFSLAAGAQPQPQKQPERQPAVEAPRFFAQAPLPPKAAAVPQVPIEVLLSDIERHVRLEQAAAEAFLEGPTRDALHSRTGSPLAN
jgi:hypothetical protein